MDLLTLSRRIPDYRSGKKIMHSAEVIIYIALAAVICGAQTWEDIALFGRCKFNYFKSVFPYLKHIPSHDTFNRFFSLLKAEIFEHEFRLWAQSLSKGYRGVVAIDGKTNKGAYSPEQEKLLRGTMIRRGSPLHRLHMVSAFAVERHLTLGQLKVDDKSNEITAIPSLLKSLDVKDCTVTIDAMGCQKKIAKEIIRNGAQYVLAVKKNHKKLYKSMVAFLGEGLWMGEKQSRISTYRTVEKGHGRIEERQCIACNYLYWLEGYKDWKDIRSFASIQSRRTIPSEYGPKTTTETRYYISSLPLNAKAVYQAARSHWAIENNLHWQLDVTFHEDDDRKKNNAAQNFSLLAKAALALLKQDTTKKNSIRTKRNGAGWDENYLHHLLTQNCNF